MQDPVPGLCNSITNELARQADPVIAAGQQNYMRNRFPFFGVNYPSAKD